MTTYEKALKIWIDSRREDTSNDFYMDIHEYDKNFNYLMREFEKADKVWGCCTYCDKPIVKSEVLGSFVCHTCDFWKKVLKDRRDCLVIIDRETYSDGGYKKDGKYCGFAGRLFFIEDMKRSKLIYTNNMWSNGTVPMRFYEGDTGKMINHFTEEKDLAFLEMIYPDMPQVFKDHIFKIRDKRQNPEKYEFKLGGIRL